MNVSAIRVHSIVLTLDEETAGLIKSLVYRTDWDQFPSAQRVAELLDELEIDGIDIDYNQDSSDFERA